MNNKWILLAILLAAYQNCSQRRFDFHFVAQQTTIGLTLNITRGLCYFNQLEYYGRIEGDQNHTFTNLRGLTKKDMVSYKVQTNVPFVIYSYSVIPKGSEVGFNATMCCYPATWSTTMDYDAYSGTKLMYSGTVEVILESIYNSSGDGVNKDAI